MKLASVLVVEYIGTITAENKLDTINTNPSTVNFSQKLLMINDVDLTELFSPSLKLPPENIFLKKGLLRDMITTKRMETMDKTIK
jgi:hypothetical protein